MEPLTHLTLNHLILALVVVHLALVVVEQVVVEALLLLLDKVVEKKFLVVWIILFNFLVYSQHLDLTLRKSLRFIPQIHLVLILLSCICVRLEL